MELNFCSLSSGSSGNCYYLGNGSQGILIDAGIPASSIRRFLKDIEIPLHSIMGVLITHNHSDHIRGLKVLVKKNNLPVFTTINVWNSIISPKLSIPRDCIREISLQKKFNLAGFDIVAFPVHHDAPETIGFQVSYGEKKMTIATDLGHICDTAGSYIKDANLLVIESNYDDQMLENGRYPQFLKDRIRSEYGHLGNHQTAHFLADIMNDNISHICLAHLSINNNTPERALNTIIKILSERGPGLKSEQQISVLNRCIPTRMIKLLE